MVCHDGRSSRMKLHLIVLQVRMPMEQRAATRLEEIPSMRELEVRGWSTEVVYKITKERT
jgi:hypothetical protein